MRCTLTSVTKKYCWIWIVVDKVWKKFIKCFFGSRGTETGQLLWEKLKKKEIGKVMTDHWRAYAEFLPETIPTHLKQKRIHLRDITAY